MDGTTAGPVRVLLADDNAGVRRAVAELLEASGAFTVVASCADGAEAVTGVRGTDPDLAVLDLTMPVLDGLAATRLVRRERPDLPVVVLTAAAEEDVVAAARAAGATGMVVKGVDPTALPDQLRSVLAGEPVWPANRDLTEGG